jgi:hypothetical protein
MLRISPFILLAYLAKIENFDSQGGD